MNKFQKWVMFQKWIKIPRMDHSKNEQISKKWIEVQKVDDFPKVDQNSKNGSQ